MGLLICLYFRILQVCITFQLQKSKCLKNDNAILTVKYIISQMNDEQKADPCLIEKVNKIGCYCGIIKNKPYSMSMGVQYTFIYKLFFCYKKINIHNLMPKSYTLLKVE